MSIYLIDPTRLEIGDMVFTHGGDFKGSVISTLTGGDFSHVMLWTGNFLVHAMPEGVYSKNTQRIALRKKSDVSVLRPSSTCDSTYGLQACRHAMKWIGALYAFAAAGASPFPRLSKLATQADKQFCSRLVAQSYEDAGLKLVPNPASCTPNELYRVSVESGLATMVANVARLATEQELGLARRRDPNLEIQAATFKWLGVVRDLAKGKGRFINHQMDVLAFVRAFPALDQAISLAVRDSGYLNMAGFDREINSYRYSAHELIKYSKENHFDPFQVLEVEQKNIDSESAPRIGALRHWYLESLKGDLKYVSQELELRYTLVQELMSRQRTLDEISFDLKYRKAM